MLRKTLLIMLIALLMLSCSAPALAAGTMPNSGSITITLADAKDKSPIAGAQLELYYVANAAVFPNGSISYVYNAAFKDCGFDISDKDLADSLAAFVDGKSIEATGLTTDKDGKASAADLPLGLYLVRQKGAVSGFAPCKPFLVSVPTVTENVFIYDVQATPKTDIEKLISISVKKVWNVGSQSNIPGIIVVELYRDDKLVDTFSLSKDNNWQVTLTDLPASDSYSVKEKSVPTGFTATYTQNGNNFIITNTSTLAQTGQLVWPIPLLASVGMLLIALGYVLLRKPGKSDA